MQALPGYHVAKYLHCFGDLRSHSQREYVRVRFGVGTVVWLGLVCFFSGGWGPSIHISIYNFAKTYISPLLMRPLPITRTNLLKKIREHATTLPPLFPHPLYPAFQSRTRTLVTDTAT